MLVQGVSSSVAGKAVAAALGEFDHPWFFFGREIPLELSSMSKCTGLNACCVYVYMYVCGNMCCCNGVLCVVSCVRVHVVLGRCFASICALRILPQ